MDKYSNCRSCGTMTPFGIYECELFPECVTGQEQLVDIAKESIRTVFSDTEVPKEVIRGSLYLLVQEIQDLLIALDA